MLDKEQNVFELVIIKTELGITVYNKMDYGRIDVFPNTKEGKERLLKFIKDELDK